MHIRLFDGKDREHLLPFVYLRPVADVFMGALTFRDRWKHLQADSVSVETVDDSYDSEESTPDRCVLAALIPTTSFVDAVQALTPNQKLVCDDLVLAYHGELASNDPALASYQSISIDQSAFTHIKHSWDIFLCNAHALSCDIPLLSKNRTSNVVSDTNLTIGDGSIFIASKGNMEGVTLNTTDGPIFIDEGAIIMEGSLLRGPLYVGKNSVIKMGTKVYANCSIGPSVKVGGEINNVVFFGNSNKGHDGFLGNAVIGEWCNIGAGTDASNLKNDYGLVRFWDYASANFAKTDLQFCGLLMGDHSQCAIQTTFNTATVVGIGCNLFGHGFPRQFIPSFSRGGAQGFTENRLDKVIETAKAMKIRRGVDFTSIDRDRLEAIFQKTASFRN
ncbi:MAG: putative sugar nucleotidyl transferase [Flavobacteriaceae bacterium]|nr:putative sugar nucleotidyl transferase [Flavobacteriaceae bacterium]